MGQQQQQQEGPVAMEEDVKMETTAEDSLHLQHGFSPDYLKLYYGKTLCLPCPSLPPSLPCVFFFLPSSPLSFVIPLFFSASKQVSKEGKTKGIVNEEIVCTNLDRSCPSRRELHVVFYFFFILFFSLFLWMLCV